MEIYSSPELCISLYLLKLQELLALLLCPTQLLNHLQSWVEIQTTEAISKIKQVHPGLALEVVDVKSKSSAFHVFRSEFSLKMFSVGSKHFYETECLTIFVGCFGFWITEGCSNCEDLRDEF